MGCSTARAAARAAAGSEAAVVSRLVDDGYVVAAGDAHFNAYGNEASQEDYVALAAEVARRYRTHRTFLLAESMGGVAGLHLLAGNRIPDLAGPPCSPAGRRRARPPHDRRAG